MTRAAAFIVLVTLGCHDSLRLVRGASNARPYGQFRRPRLSPMRGGGGDYRTTSFVAYSPSSSAASSARERERSMTPAASSAVKAPPWGAASWVARPQARRLYYSERPWESSKPHSTKDGGSSCTAAEEAEGCRAAAAGLGGPHQRCGGG